MAEKRKFGLSSFTLSVMAMIFMLIDHIWATIVAGNSWMTCIGRLAFPIFAFMISEGYFHTKDFKKYMKRLVIFALISEIPFNSITGGSIIYPFNQNVMWTFVIGLSLIHLNEKMRKKGKLWITILTAIGTVILGGFLGTLAMVDYKGAGVLTVLTFYFFRQKKWWSYVAQFLTLYYLNVEMLGGLFYEVMIFGTKVLISQQGFALFALIPIWLYDGRKGYSSKKYQYFKYWFYPAHMAILYLLAMF